MDATRKGRQVITFMEDSYKAKNLNAVIKIMFANISILMSISIGFGVTLYGLWFMPWPAASDFGWSSLFHYEVLLISGASVIALAARWAKLNAIVVGACIACIIAIITGAIWPVIVTIWFFISCYVLGVYFIRFLKIDGTKVTGITSVLVGACLYGTAVSFVAHFPVNYPGLYGFALAFPVLLGWRSIPAAMSSFRECLTSPSETKLLDLAIASIALVHFSVTLMPEVGHDALAMHLFIPGHLATRHEWAFDVNTYVWAVMPMMGDWLFSIGYMLAGEQAARLINVGFIFALGWLIRDLVLWAGGNAIGARWAVLLFLTTPLTFTESSSLFIESIWSAFVLAGSLAVLKVAQSEDDQTTNLSLAGILLGGAAAAKAITLIILPVLFLVLVWRYRAWIKYELIGAIAVGLVLFSAIGSIPYATAWNIASNPVFPFFNHVFQSPFYPAVAFDQSAFFAKGLTWDILYQVTFHSEKYLESEAGSAGFQWLLLFTPAFLILVTARHSRGLVLFIVAALTVALTFQSTAYLRYVFPSFAWLAAGIGVAFSLGYRYPVFLRNFLYVIGWSVILLNIAFFKSGTNYGDFSLDPLMSESGRETYLNNRLPIRNAVDLVNNRTSRTPVAVFASPLTAGLNSDALYASWYNLRFQDKVSDTETSNDMGQLLMDEGVDYVILDNNWGTPDKRTLIEAVTQQLAVFGGVTVRKLIDSYRFQTELLKNPDFRAFDGWSSSNDNFARTTGRALVTVTAPAAQPVSVVSGRRYQNSVTAMCADQLSQGRVQTNWLDSKGSFIIASIHVFDCTPEETTHSIEVTAPANATSAYVYATSHSNVPIIITNVSFRQ